MKEQVISKETAILAKEKGFDYLTIYAYLATPKHLISQYGSTYLRTNGNPFGDFFKGKNWNKKYESNKNKIVCSAPTQSLLAKWLREVHNIHVTVEYIYTSKTYIVLIRSYDPTYKANSIGFGKNYNYEQALEEGLKHALKYLIKSTNNNDIS